MRLPFFKYHGTGNDFILIDNRAALFRGDTTAIKHLCHRRFGIGADGLILLQDKPGYDFEMVYYNADGNTSSMCGNGGRCITAFAARLGIIKDHTNFMAVDGPHQAKIISYDPLNHEAIVSLQMKDIEQVEKGKDFYFLDTGSPHYVTYVDEISTVNVNEEGEKVRNNQRFKEKGTNVNFVQEQNETLQVRTYERGVEAETWSCGTGVTASALVTALKNDHAGFYQVETPGGSLRVYFEKAGQGFKNVFLQGPATFVFDGNINY